MDEQQAKQAIREGLWLRRELAQAPPPPSPSETPAPAFTWEQLERQLISLSEGPERAAAAAWDVFMTRHYHQPSDETDLPWRWDVAARWGDYLAGVVDRVAAADERPRWYRGDTLGDLFAPGRPRAARP